MQAFRTLLLQGSRSSRSFTTSMRLNEIFKIQSVEEFKEKVEAKSKDQVIIVDFFATWCGPCKLLTPRIETVVGEHKGKVSLAKVDVDEYNEIAFDYDVSSIPVLVAIKNGKVEERLVGLQDTDKLRTWVANAIKKL